jgi:hypothetical protein
MHARIQKYKASAQPEVSKSNQEAFVLSNLILKPKGKQK